MIFQNSLSLSRAGSVSKTLDGPSEMRARQAISKVVAVTNRIARRITSAVGIAFLQRLVSEGVHQIVRTKFQGFGRVTQRQGPFVQPLPNLAKVIVVIDDHSEPAVIIFETQKLDWLMAVWRAHVE